MTPSDLFKIPDSNTPLPHRRAATKAIQKLSEISEGEKSKSIMVVCAKVGGGKGGGKGGEEEETTVMKFDRAAFKLKLDTTGEAACPHEVVKSYVLK